MNHIILIRNRKELLNFCRHHKDIYLYGAGRYGRLFKEFLDLNGIAVTAFIVTHKMNPFYCQAPVFEADEILPLLNNDCGIIFSLSNEFHEEILNRFLFPCPICCLKSGRAPIWLDVQAFFFLKKWDHAIIESAPQNIIDGQSVIIIQIEFTYGDIIWSTPLLRELRRNLPHSKISMVINSNMTSLLSNCPYIDKIIPFNLNYSFGEMQIKEIYENVKHFCEQYIRQFDVAFLPRLLPTSIFDLWENVFICIASNAKIRVAHMEVIFHKDKVMARIFKRYFSHLIQHKTGEHEVERNLSLLTTCGLNVQERQMELWFDSDARVYAESFYTDLRRKRKRFFVIIGLVGTNPARSWAPNLYNELMSIISKHFSSVYFILCGGNDAVESAQISKIGLLDSCVDITGKTSLLQVAAVINGSDMYIGSDTGLMHMAAACGKPIIELSYSLPDSPDTFGSHPVRTGPWGVPNIVLRPPHGLDECKYICRRKSAHCINQITPQEVMGAFESLCASIYKR